MTTEQQEWLPRPDTTAILQRIADNVPLDEVCRQMGIDPDDFATPDYGRPSPTTGSRCWRAMASENALLRRVLVVLIAEYQYLLARARTCSESPPG